MEPLSCDLRVGERQSVVCILEEGEGRVCLGLRAPLILRLIVFLGFRFFFFFIYMFFFFC